MSKNQITLVADTNLFIQCRDLKELPWDQLGEYDEIKLVVTRPVQKEIDRQKGGGNGRLAQRARTISSLLKATLDNSDSKIIRDSSPKVSLDVHINILPDPSLKDALDFNEPDDALVGVVAALGAQQQNSNVCLLSHDIGPLASAKAIGLPSLQIPDSWLLKPEDSKQDKELKAAKAEIARLRQAEPSIQLECIDGTGNPVTSLTLEKLSYAPLTEEEIGKLLSLAKSQFPRSVPQVPKSDDSSSAYAFVTGIGLVQPSQERVERYNQDYDQWEKDLVSALSKIHQALNAQAKVLIGFQARNIGTRPAENVLVEILTRGSLLIQRTYSKDKDTSHFNLPKPPTPPKPRSATAMLADFNLNYGLGNPALSLPNLASISNPDPEDFYYKTQDNRYSPGTAILLTAQLWRHGQEAEFFVAELWPLEKDTIKGAVEFKVHASNLIDGASILIPITLKTLDQSSYKEAKKALSLLGNNE